MFFRQGKCAAAGLALLFSVSACSVSASNGHDDWSAADTNMRGKNMVQAYSWRERLHNLSIGKQVKFRILQLGDSHTAGDFFTDELRTKLQQQWGDGGIGWVYPATVSGQRTATAIYQGKGWQTVTSRKDRDTDFPLGGVVARSQGNGQIGTISPTRPSGDVQHITFVVRPVSVQQPLTVTDAKGQTRVTPNSFRSGDWKYFSFRGYPPVNYAAAPGDTWEVGYVNIENTRPGIILSAMGINGAQISESKKWRTDWARDLEETRADLVMLSYGTNEAFENPLDAEKMATDLRQVIAQIHRALPNAGVMIIGAPESLKSRKGTCGTRAASLDEVQRLQKEIARQQGALYWSWQEAMGGECSMKKWIAEGLAGKDGVHFTGKGYKAAADSLVAYMTELAQQSE